MSQQHKYYMQLAIEQAKLAAQAGEVPVGAVLVLNDEVIATSFNQPISGNDPTSHAEIEVLRAGAEKLNNYRLLDTTLYVTLEPCMMCAGAMVHARIGQLVFGAYDPKSGVVSSRAKLLDESFLNHKVAWQGGVMADECGSILSLFFKSRR